MLESEMGWPMLESSGDAGLDSLLLESRSYMLLARKKGKIRREGWSVGFHRRCFSPASVT